jgi:hypothetical protein
MRLAWSFFKAAMCMEHDVRSELRIGAQSQFVQSERPRDFVGTLEHQAASAPAVPMRQARQDFRSADAKGFGIRLN